MKNIQNMREETYKKKLVSARNLFQTRNYESSKEQLESLNDTNLSIEINLLLIEHKINIQNDDIILNALLKLLMQQNNNQLHLITITKPIKETILYQYLYWNIMVIALRIGRLNLSSIIAEEALMLYGGFRKQTSLFFLYQILDCHLNHGRIASFIQFFGKYDKILKMTNKLQARQQQYSSLCKINRIRCLLKLNMLTQSQSNYMLAFDEADSDVFNQEIRNNNQTNGNEDIENLKFNVFKQFLHAQIQYCSDKYHNSISILGQIIINQSNQLHKQHTLLKLFIQNNLAVILYKTNKPHIARKYFNIVLNKLHTMCNSPTHHISQYQRVHQNIIYTYLGDSSEQAYHTLGCLNFSNSYQFNYRKAQICIQYYNFLCQKSRRHLPWSDIHDNYETTYYYPNSPYQHKSKNKNTFHANNRYIYRRYVVNSSETQQDNHQKEVLRQVLLNAQKYLKNALMILSKEVRISNESESQSNKQINEKLLKQHSRFNLSILACLCYVQLNLNQWSKCISYGKMFQQHDNIQFVQYNFPVMIYLMEAYCQLGKFEQAYEVTNQMVRMGIKDNYKHQVKDSSFKTIFEKADEMSVFLYNVAVLHTKDNHIPQSYQYIQKIYTHKRMSPNASETNMSLSLVDLMIHYNLRIHNYSSALQMVKRKRILTMQGLNGIRSLLNITK